MNTVQRGNAARQANKIKRRNKILSIARNLISEEGYEAFTISKLAKTAEVTIPTIHNLFGKKLDIFQELVEAMVEGIEQALIQPDIQDPITAVEVFTDNLLALYREDEAFYKAAFVAGERAQLFEHVLPTGIYHKSLKIALWVCVEARKNGYLAGEISDATLAHQLFGGQRLARQDWVNGYIDLNQYRIQVLTSMFLTMLADATPDFRAQLLGKIAVL